jgi:hypothetical protein
VSDPAIDDEAEVHVRWARREVARRRRPLRRTENAPIPTNRAPVRFENCPVHGQKVGVDGEGRLLGRCDGCAREYARALMLMRRNA